MKTFISLILISSFSFAQVDNPLENPRNYKTGEELESKPKVEPKRKVFSLSRNYKTPLKVDTIMVNGTFRRGNTKRNYKQP